MKKIVNFLFLLFFLYITLQVFINSNQVINSVINSIDIWKNRLFPTLFPFFIISDFLINYGLINYLSIIFNKPFRYLFKTSGIGSFVFFLSMLSGFPSSAKYIKELYDSKYIDEIEATKLLTFTHFSNPLFIIGFVGIFLPFKYCILILIVHYITNIFIGLIFRNSYISNNSNKINKEIKIFGIVLKESITKTIDTLLLILGTITFFMIINTIINNLNISNYFKSFLNCFLEMTNGINYIGLSSLNYNVKTTIITMILSFGGISVHFQVLSIISNTKIKYQPYLIARLLHCSISGILVFICINLFY